MPVVMKMRWEGVTPDQYDQVKDKVQWIDEKPDGAIHHVAWFEGNALMVVDVWEKAEDFQRFTDDRLMPGVQAVGLEGAPEVDIQPTHAVYDAVHKETL